jgi:hypothetical protein
MRSERDKEKEKRTYQKPRLRTIELAAEEVLARGCKFADTAFPNVGFDHCGDGVCFDLGS